MPHIDLPVEYPGIRSLFVYRPETAATLCHLAQVLLHDPHPTLSAGERELIASYVSNLNTCNFCTRSHSAIAKHQLGSNLALVKQVLADPETAPISNKLRALLRIAAKVQTGGKNVLTVDVEQARRQGATDIEIHDTVLIAAAFCMYNRYVDGLATWQPDDEAFYDKMGEQRTREGYKPTSINFTLTQELQKS
ncbi:carboxymuconolactone decarboxylase family protein [Mucilaginibacter sp. BT774]|uniref:carboxymuconolactone decarboxylase family protein n=1 Tax=Mucilaginibacter sp. BT774 TaxID=3062276 RepID=UPI00267477B2|nr:carboxymuconolactone decarboxylase family protein [Mucilaginibacter sp. BT774]MDO3628040.1 carboxymuconolactone decarboxylase family protein [Mucilaginibacter sp. BT774]